MGLQMNKALKSLLTPQLTEMKEDREDRFAEIKRNVTTALKGRDPEKKAAAEIVEIFLRPYWDFSTKAMNTQTGVLIDLFGKYKANEPFLPPCLNKWTNCVKPTPGWPTPKARNLKRPRPKQINTASAFHCKLIPDSVSKPCQGFLVIPMFFFIL